MIQNAISATVIRDVFARCAMPIAYRDRAEHVRWPGIELVGPLSAGSQDITVFAAGLWQHEAGAALMRFITSLGGAAEANGTNVTAN
jgi:hypothetical protein